MKNKIYIMVGAPIITKEIFHSILRPLDNYSFKPTGGFWASELISFLGNISPWNNYLIDNRDIAAYKNLNQSTIFTLKENSKILEIDNINTVIELIKKYPSVHQKFSYYQEIKKENIMFDFEQLSQIYDGIYVNFDNFQSKRDTIIFDKWDVNTLLLFNLDCIKEYQTAPITFDKYDFHSFPYIKRDTIGTPQKIEEPILEYSKISTHSKLIFQELISQYHSYEFINYDEYLSIVVSNIAKTLSIMNKEEQKNITEIISYLNNKNLKTNPDTITRNILLNNISEYLIEDEKRIKSLNPSPIKKIKKYSIY